MAQARTTTASKGRARSTAKKPTTLQSFNPRTGEVMREIPTTPVGDVKEIVAQARKVQPEWAAIPPEGRARMLNEVKHRIYERLDDIVEVVSKECGKPRFEALAHDVMPPILMLMTLGKVAPKALRPQRVGSLSAPVLPKLLGGLTSRTEWQPFGVVGAITPWNYPITNSFLAFLPALYAGNTLVIKPSEVTPGCGEMIRELLDPLPAGVATVIQGGGDVGGALVDAPVDKVSFIGSPATGRLICEAAAKNLTPVVMELGGKDAAIVCDDADLELASSGLVWGAFYNAGQTCCSIERAYVVDAVADEFQRLFLDKLSRVRQGSDDGEVGSITFKKQYEIVAKQVKDAVKKGGRLLAGGVDAGPKNEKGTLWFAPTVIENVNEDMAVVQQESFGPILSIVRVQDEDEAVRRANEDGVNLTASLWTRDKRRSDRLAPKLRAGTVTTNFHGETAAVPWSPWGGVGESGFGRLNGELGVREFVVPVHVARTSMPTKRIWWYPYDDETETAIRGVVAWFGGRDLSTKVAGFRQFASHVGKALKNKF